MSKSCLQCGHLSRSVVSQMPIRKQRRRLKRKRRLFCLFELLLRGRSMRPCPSFPSSISSRLCLLSGGSAFSCRRQSCNVSEISLLILSWHLFMEVLFMNLVIPVGELSPVQICAIAGAYLLKI